MQGYRERKQWVAAQLPLSHTIIDFWQLIIEQDTEIVVQLEGNPVSGDRDCFGEAFPKYLVFTMVELIIKNILNVGLLQFLHAFASSLKI